MKSLSFRSVSAFIVTAAIITIAGCGGSGSSSSGGSGGSFSTGGTMVKGNITSVNTAMQIAPTGFESYVYRLGDSLVSTALAEERAVGGIKVCIEDRCGMTDANGNFEIDMEGYPGGEYILKFYVGEREFRTRIELRENAVVNLDGISITDDGVVRISNVRVELIENDPPGEEHVVMCHKEEGQEPRTIEVPIAQKGAHLEHGDHLGECGGGPPVQHFLVCHVEGDDQITMEVTAGGKAEHLEFHPNDYPGECEPIHEENFLICHVEGDDQITKEVTAGGKAEHLEFHPNDYPGECEPIHEEYFHICHVEGDDQITKEVTAGGKAEHLEHHDRDYDGRCED